MFKKHFSNLLFARIITMRFPIEVNKAFIFLFGALVGLFISNIFHSTARNETLERALLFYEKAISLWQSKNMSEINKTIEVETSSTSAAGVLTQVIESGNFSLADELYNETRVLCWVMTGPSNHMTKAIHVKKTWGSRCNKLLFMSSADDPRLGTIKLSVEEGRDHLWRKTREAFKYIYENHLDDADWFMKADDDTYVVVENLRAFLYSFSTEAPVYFGCKFKPLVKQGYMSGGAGYVLSKEAVRRFVEQAYPNKTLCSPDRNSPEDVEMGNCLQNVGVAAGDTRDFANKGRFFPLNPAHHLVNIQNSSWYWSYIFYPTNENKLNCCSNYVITFHYITPDNFYMLDYIIYGVKVFGIFNRLDVLPSKYDTNELVLKWRAEKSNNTHT